MSDGTSVGPEAGSKLLGLTVGLGKAPMGCREGCDSIVGGTEVVDGI